MTRLTSNKSVTRETSIIYRRRALIVSLRPGYLMIRPKGTREGQEVAVDYGMIYELGMKIRAREQAAAKGKI